MAKDQKLETQIRKSDQKIRSKSQIQRLKQKIGVKNPNKRFEIVSKSQELENKSMKQLYYNFLELLFNLGTNTDF